MAALFSFSSSCVQLEADTERVCVRARVWRPCGANVTAGQSHLTNHDIMLSTGPFSISPPSVSAHSSPLALNFLSPQGETKKNNKKNKKIKNLCGRCTHSGSTVYILPLPPPPVCLFLPKQKEEK